VAAEYVAAVFLVCAVAFAFCRAFTYGDGVDFGWLAVGCLIIAVWLLPVLLDVGRAAAAPP
jgi:hypothetical protein